MKNNMLAINGKLKEMSPSASIHWTVYGIKENMKTMKSKIKVKILLNSQEKQIFIISIYYTRKYWDQEHFHRWALYKDK
jgi:hypothetical protein